MNSAYFDYAKKAAENMFREMSAKLDVEKTRLFVAGFAAGGAFFGDLTEQEVATLLQHFAKFTPVVSGVQS